MKTIYNNQGTIPRKYTHRRAAAIPECVAFKITHPNCIYYTTFSVKMQRFFSCKREFFQKTKKQQSYAMILRENLIYVWVMGRLLLYLYI